MENLAIAFLHTERPERAFPLFRSFLELRGKQLGNDSPQFAGLQAMIALDLLKANQWSEAESLLRECLVTRAHAQPDDWTTFHTKSMLGAALLGQKKYTDAEPLLAAGYEGMQQRREHLPRQDQMRPSEVVERLVQLYTAWEKPEQATEWQKKLDAHRNELAKQEVINESAARDKPPVESK